MRFELVCIGSELLSGKVNTHIAYIGEKLSTLGIELAAATTAPDDLNELVRILKASFERAGAVIITGGLGPTFDDITRQAVSEALGRKLVFNRDILAGIARMFADRGKEMPKNNETQAYIIEGAMPIVNKTGTAPGQIILPSSGKPLIILLPGPPREMHPMMEGTVIPYLREKYEAGILKKKILHVYGLAESKVDEMVRPLIEAERQMEGGAVSFTILEHTSFIDVVYSVSGKDELLVDDILRKIRTKFAGILGKHIFGEDTQTLESIAGEFLIRGKKTLSVAESCTGGLLAHRITNVPGSSAYFKLGLESYSNDSKIAVLGVNAETLEKFGAVSEETAVQMATGVLKVSKSDIALALTGIAGPGGGTKEKPVGTVCFAIVKNTPAGKKPEPPLTSTARFHGSRFEIKERAASYALFMIKDALT